MIIGIYGKQGSGKTLLGIRSILQKKDHYEKIYSNIKIKGVKYKDFDEDFFSNLLELKIKNSLIFFDEIQEYINSRKFMSKANIDYGTFIRQVRKLGNTLIWTSQFIYQVDKVLRSNTDIFIKAYSNYEGYNKKEVVLEKLNIFYEVYSVDAEGFFNLISRKSLNNASVYALSYDSSEIVKNDNVTKNEECQYFLNMLCNKLEGKYDYNFKPEIKKDLVRFAKMVRIDIFKIYKIRNKK